jgi:hypothetical protein
VWNFVNHFRQPGVGANWKSLPQWFKEHNYTTLASGKLYHPSHPPNDDYPTSWTTAPDINPWYWGNQLPIGDADKCAFSGPTGLNMTAPLRAKFNNGLVCTLIPFKCLIFPSIPSSIPPENSFRHFSSSPACTLLFSPCGPHKLMLVDSTWQLVDAWCNRSSPGPTPARPFSIDSLGTLAIVGWVGGGYRYLREANGSLSKGRVCRKMGTLRLCVP